VTRQYQPLAAPFVQSGAAETVTVDKWFPQLLGLVRRPSAAALLQPAQSDFGVLTDVPVQAWQPRFDDRVPPRPRAAWFQPTRIEPTYVADVTVLAPARSWAPSYPDFARGLWFRSATQQALAWSTNTPGAQPAAPELAAPVYPARVFGRTPVSPPPHWTAPLYVPDVTATVTALSWRAQFPDRLNPPAALRASLQRVWESDKFTAPTQVIAPDLFGPRYPDRVYARAPLTPHPSWTAPLYVPDVTVTAPALSWRARYPDDVRRPTFSAAAQRASFWATDTPIDVPNLAAPVYPSAVVRPRFEAARQPSFSAPSYVADVTVVSPSHASWRTVAPDWIARRTFPASAQQFLAWHTDTPPTLVSARVVTVTGWSSNVVSAIGTEADD
jgi:hypothetical protein